MVLAYLPYTSSVIDSTLYFIAARSLSVRACLALVLASTFSIAVGLNTLLARTGLAFYNNNNNNNIVVVVVIAL